MINANQNSLLQGSVNARLTSLFNEKEAKALTDIILPMVNERLSKLDHEVSGSDITKAVGSVLFSMLTNK